MEDSAVSMTSIDLPSSSPYDDSTVARVCARVYELKAINQRSWVERQKVRDVMDGGPAAVSALIGKQVRDLEQRLPVANFILAAVERLGWKLGRRPDVKVDPPISSDSDSARKGAEKRARIVESLDADCGLDLMLPQMGRWLPGYGFSPLVIRQGFTLNGDPFPLLELRDPYTAFPGEWTAGQQPPDLALCRVIGERRLAEMFPKLKDRILGPKWSGSSGVVLLDRQGAGWENQSGSGLEIYEYMNRTGTWWVCPEKQLLLGYEPNLLTRPMFYVAKRYSFNLLAGQYDQALGLMALAARMNLLLVIGTEDSVMAEINVVGDFAQGDNYNFGRRAVNVFEPGTSVSKVNSQVPFQAFQQAQQLERHLRIIAAYPATEDAQSPNSFVTGRGLEELNSSVGLEVNEYRMVEAHALQWADSARLEWLETLYPNREMQMAGTRKGAGFSEKYTPKTHIRGNHATRRVFGAMAGFDDSTKIVAGLQLLQGDIIDDDTFRENLDGLENHERIKERILANKAQGLAFDTLAAMAQQGDQRAMSTAIGLLPEGKMRSVLEEFFVPSEEEAAAAEAAAAVPGELEGLEGGEPPDVATVLSRLTGAGAAQGGVQTVGTL